MALGKVRTIGGVLGPRVALAGPLQLLALIASSSRLQQFSRMYMFKARIFDGVELAFKRMVSLHLNEMIYLPHQIIAYRGVPGQSLVCLLRGVLQVRQ